MTRTISAIFDTRRAMEEALRRFETVNVTDDQINVIMTDDTRNKFFKLETHNKVDEGLAAGATFGGIVGGVMAAVMGAGTLAIPGLNLVVVGSVVAGLAGAAVGAATGGLVGGLIGLGIPEHEAKLYEGKLKSGNILLAVEPRDGDQAKAIREILENTDAYNIAA
jgi:uncharacterized membrane protein